MQWRQLLTIAFCALAIASVVWWVKNRDPQTVELILATGPRGGAFHSMGKGISDYVRRSDQNIRIRLTTDSVGSTQNMQRLKDGDVDLAIVQNDTQPDGVDAHTLIPLHRAVCHFLVPLESDIRNIYDLRGKSVGVGNENSGNYHLVHELLGHFGVLEEEHEFVPLYETIPACGSKLESGEADAALVVTAITSEALTKLITRGKVRYVSLATRPGEGNEVDGFAVTYPYVERFTIPKYVYPVHDDGHGRPAEPCESFAIRSTLVCRGDLPDEVAHTIVEAIITNHAALMRDHREARDITENFDAADVQFPIHHGAMAYYQRQRPSMLERYAEPMAFLLSLFLALCGFGAGINKWLTVRKKNRIDEYYKRLDVLLTELNSPDLVKARLDCIEAELTAMRHNAVSELVNERLLADDSFQIFQSLLTDCLHKLESDRQALG